MEMVKLQNILSRTYNGVKPLWTINVESKDVAWYIVNGFSLIKKVIKDDKTSVIADAQAKKDQEKTNADAQAKLDVQTKKQAELDAEHAKKNAWFSAKNDADEGSVDLTDESLVVLVKDLAKTPTQRKWTKK